jgi:uncharacterized membrane protein YdjX (TVP38/TMEM64 family)
LASTTIGGFLRLKIENSSIMLNNLKKGLEKHPFLYLMILRLVPLFPFWFVNLAPSMFGIPLRTFALATYIGIAPGLNFYELK